MTSQPPTDGQNPELDPTRPEAPQAVQPTHEGPPPVAPNTAEGENPFAAAPVQAALTREPPPKRDRPFLRGLGLGTGAGLGVGAALLVVGGIGSVITGLIFMAMMGATTALAGSGQTAVEPLYTAWGPEEATDTLRAISVTGTIMADASDGGMLTEGTYGYEVADVLDNLTDEEAGGVVLLMNTPGGSITGSRAIADAVDRYRERTENPVYAYVVGMSASGGMYTMAGADEILADHGSLIGSVGVIMGPISHYSDVVAVDGGLLGTGVTTTGGIDQEYITAGRSKDVGNPFRPLSESERANYQALVDYEYAEFVGQVATKRGIAESVMVDEVGAALLDTERATKVGYIDGVMGRDEAFRHFAEGAGMDPAQTRVVESLAPNAWWSLLGVESRQWGVAAAAEPIDGQPARATSSLCVGPPVPVAWYGPTAAHCG